MLIHRYAVPTPPTRVVVIGSRGFIGRNLVAGLEARGTTVLALSSTDLDLAAAGAGDRLADALRPDDAVVMLSALTPDKGRTVDVSMANLRMGEAVCAALVRQPVAHVVYFSTDGVYGFATTLVSEATPVAPPDVYGAMHLMREAMVKTVVSAPLAILRCTAAYGAGDTHNSYGPNRFRRQAAREGRIVLGGGGEETRDHLYIDDAVGLVLAVLDRRSAGLLNLASGRSITFLDLARKVAARFASPVEIVTTPRTVPVSHRHFDGTTVMKAFPAFRFTPLDHGLDQAHAADEGE